MHGGTAYAVHGRDGTLSATGYPTLVRGPRTTAECASHAAEQIIARPRVYAASFDATRVHRMERVLLLLATFCAAVLSGIGFSHALQRAEKRRLAAPVFVQVQNTIYNRYGEIAGAIEVAALVLLVALLFVVPAGSLAMWLIGIAAICVAVMIGIWVVWVRPINIEIRRWTPEAYPDDWAHYRDRWSALHGMRLLAAMIALALLLLALSSRPAA
jgi:hypothetical protein